ncbi:hypothetical protein FDT66_05770 [Polaribacter aestuariivivens]|uniref:Lipoprotein n=1 Tax=Polaribacter aestuariivivens TaxID=2304626 RepID=A0A5S3NCN7_9FLAO|nr:hypothetical protein [Polaribacter aestuariivivens]TMM31469.1 hypothetical protein FDT66_05770 [Polaribacter aestuariivivens]
MKKVIVSIVFISLLIFSCKRKQVDVPIFSYSILNDSVKNFKLNINEKQATIYYEYLHQNDSIKKLYLTYNNDKDILISNLDTFHFNKKTYNSKSLQFKFYQKKEINNHNRSLVFNENYGLLANLAYGSDYLFLKDSISKTDKKLLFKALFYDLNKIETD